MAFPNVAAKNSGANCTGGGTQTHTLTLPAGTAAGDLLIVLFAGNSTTAGDNMTAALAGSRAIYAGSENLAVRYIFAIIATADIVTAGTLTVTTNESGYCDWLVYRYDGSADTFDVDLIEYATTTGSSNSGDPPNLAPSWGTAEDTSWLAFVLTGQHLYSWAAPGGYADAQESVPQGSLSFGATLIGYTKDEAASSFNPAAAPYDFGVSRNWTSFTLAIIFAAGRTFAPDAFGTEAGFQADLEFSVPEDVTVYPMRHGLEVGIRAGLRLSTSGPRQVMLTGNGIETPEMTEGGTEGQVLTYHEDTKPSWEDGGGPGGATALDDLTDVEAPSPSDGDVLAFDDYAGVWVNAPAPSGVTHHGDLTGLDEDDHPQYMTAAEVIALLTPDWYVCDSLTATKGTVDTGSHTDLHAQGGTTVGISEVVGTPGIHIELAFSGVDALTGWEVIGYYVGSATHEVDIQVWNYDTSAWVTVGTMLNAATPQVYSGTWTDGAPYFDGGGNAKMRFYHGDPGNTSHDLYLDYAVIGHTEGGGVPVFALDDLTDVNAPSPDDGDALVWDDYAGVWVAAPPSGVSDIVDLPTADTTTTKVLSPDGSGGVAWRAESAGGSVATDAIWDAAGDLAVGSGSNTAGRLAKGSDGDVLRMASGAVGWGAPAGMTNPMDAVGDLIRGGASGAPTKHVIGSTGEALTVRNGLPAWQDAFTPGDMAPLSPSAWDEEMDALPATGGANPWTWEASSGSPTNQTIGEYPMDVTRYSGVPSYNVTDIPGALVMQPITAGKLKVWRLLPVTAGGVWMVAAKVRLIGATGQDDRISLVLGAEAFTASTDEPTTTGLNVQLRRISATAYGARAYRKAGADAVAGTEVPSQQGWAYLLVISKVGGNLACYASGDGIGWLRVGEFNGAAMVPTHLALAVNDGNSSDGPCIGVVDWLRFVAGSANPLRLFGGALAQSTAILRPTGDGDASGSVTYSTGTVGYVLLDEAVVNSADYVDYKSASGRLLYTFPSTGVSSGTIVRVRLNWWGTNAAPAGAQTVYVRIGGTNYNVGSIGQTAGSPTVITLATSPATGIAWTWAEVNALEWGFAALAAPYNMRCYDIAAEVDYTP